MFKFLSKYFRLLLLLILVTACSKKADDDIKQKSGQQTDPLFSGLSRYSVEQQTPHDTDEANTSNNIFANVLPGYNITFPLDHGSHPEFAVEWWYITANLTDKQNNPYALQWTLFRFASNTQNTPWANAQQYMGHVGLRDGKQAWFEERFARGVC